VNLVFSERAWNQYLRWQAEDAKMLDRVNALIKECKRDPFRGTGKPEPLGGNLAGWWSRRIDLWHRLVYRVAGTGKDQILQIAQCRYHY
jgi:toxin YoeB